MPIGTIVVPRKKTILKDGKEKWYLHEKGWTLKVDYKEVRREERGERRGRGRGERGRGREEKRRGGEEREKRERRGGEEE
jgi:hypothetical protein